ncbi:RING finger domain-containing protein, partial [Salmonella sp. s51228]|uniref:RING finger domain-containing protein n=1 Tax=Salmonella sp. s51228 TaxID=3159652 RepID=UPI00397EE505
MCLDNLDSENNPVRELTKCKHQFHENCISTALSHNSRCPLCLTPVGTIQGTQPDNGKLTYTHVTMPLPGYPNCGHIHIKYTFPGGKQGSQHPSP